MSATSARHLRVAVVGCGKVAQNLHLPAVQKSKRCELVAVCDASTEVAEGVARRYQVERVYTDVGDAMGDSSVDAVLISVGDPLHVEVALRALRAGKHVLVEKPLGVSAAECETLRDEVRRTGLILQVGVMKRSDPGVEYAKRAIERVGKILSFGIWYRAAADALVDEDAVFLPVIRDSGYTRPAYKLDRKPYYLATHGSHLFDNLRYLLGDAVSVRANLSVRGDVHAWNGLAELKSGAHGHFDLVVYVQSEWSEGLAVYGERGAVMVSTPNPFFLRPSSVRVYEADHGKWHEPLFTEGDAYLRQLDAFAASILDGAAVVAAVEDGIAALALIEAVAASAAAGGERVEVAHA